MGMPEQIVVKKREPQKSPIGKTWISTLFLLQGGRRRVGIGDIC